MRFAPQQASHMSQNLRNVISAKRQAPAAAGKTSTELIHVIKSQERIFCQKKAPAAGWKTSTELIHVIKSQERNFCQTKRRLRQLGRPQQS